MSTLRAGLGEGVQLMRPREKRRFWIPPALTGRDQAGAPGTLIFDVELLDVR